MVQQAAHVGILKFNPSNEQIHLAFLHSCICIKYRPMFWHFISSALIKNQNQYNTCHSLYGKWIILMTWCSFCSSHKWLLRLHKIIKTLFLRQKNIRYLPYRRWRDPPKQLPGTCNPVYHSMNMVKSGNRITESIRHRRQLLLCTDWTVISLPAETKGSALLVPKPACPWALSWVNFIHFLLSQHSS